MSLKAAEIRVRSPFFHTAPQGE